jgi:hypothetical protein
LRWRERKYYEQECLTGLMVSDTEIGPTGAAVWLFVEDEELHNAENPEEVIQNYFAYLEAKLDARAGESSRG